MDTLTHALAGALVARAICVRAPQRPPAAVPPQPAHGRLAAAWDGQAGAPLVWQAVLVGAVAGAFPDIDVLARWAGEMAFLRHHRGITHSLLLAPLWAALLAVAISAAFAAVRAPRVGWKSLYAIALAAIVLHIAGDWITHFGTLLLAPLSDARFGLGAVFVIDPVFSGVLLAGLLAAAVWPRQRWPALAGLALASGWVVLAWDARHDALAAGHAHAARAGIAVVEVDAMPRPASPFNWTVVVYDGSAYHVAHLNTRRRAPLAAGPEAGWIRRLSAVYVPAAQAVWEVVPRFGAGADAAWARQVWQHEQLATFRWFAAAPVLVQTTERRTADGRVERCAVFGDLRFGFPGRGELPFRYGLCLHGERGATLVRMVGEAVLPL
jgi:inner membrane protein